MVAAVEIQELPTPRLAVIHAAYSARTGLSGRAWLAPSTNARFAGCRLWGEGDAGSGVCGYARS